ncbi:LOW QUALITY PROTEIN: leucine-rich repeat-containing protein 3C [Erethizon dorsatum]
MAQVSDTWGPESHTRKPNTLEPQAPAASCYSKQGFGGGSRSPELSSRAEGSSRPDSATKRVPTRPSGAYLAHLGAAQADQPSRIHRAQVSSPGDSTKRALGQESASGGRKKVTPAHRSSRGSQVESTGGGGHCSFSCHLLFPRSHATPGLCPSAATPPAALLLPLLLVIGTRDAVPSAQSPPQGCYVAEEAGERTFRCSQAGLSAVPLGIPNDTRKLYLDANRLASVPAGAFQHLSILEELDLSHNILAHLSGAAFQGLAGTLRHLDLSANRLASVPVEAFVGLQIQVNLSTNPWHCDCALQEVLRQVRLVPGTGTGIVCGSGARPDLVGQEFLLLAREEELCGIGHSGAQRSTDVALLVAMGGWLMLVVAYLAHYVWQNRDESRRPLKRAPVLPVCSEDSSTLSTVV